MFSSKSESYIIKVNTEFIFGLSEIIWFQQYHKMKSLITFTQVPHDVSEFCMVWSEIPLSNGIYKTTKSVLISFPVLTFPNISPIFSEESFIRTACKGASPRDSMEVI